MKRIERRAASPTILRRSVISAVFLAGVMHGASLRAQASPEDEAGRAQERFGAELQRGFGPTNTIAIDIRVRKILAAQLQLPIERITDQARFQVELGMDSLSAVEFILELEKEFGITLSEADAQKIETVGQAIAFVKARLTK